MAGEANAGTEESAADWAGMCRLDGGVCSSGFSDFTLALSFGYSLLLVRLGALMDKAAPGGTILSKRLPALSVDVETLQGGLDAVLKAFLWTTLTALSRGEFSVEELFGQALIWHPDDMAGPSKERFLEDGMDAEGVGLG